MPTTARSVRRSFGGGVLAAAVVWAGLAIVTGARPQEAANDNNRLAPENGILEKLVDLANGKNFYLVLDPTALDLTLMLRGAELRRYHLIALQVGVPRVVFGRRQEPRPWQGVVWSDGRLDPPRALDRLEITPPPPGTPDTTTPIVPPTPEEAYPVPSRYHIRFGDGPAIEIRPREADEKAGRWSRFSAWWSARWRDAVAALRTRPDELVRLRVVLAPEDADTLYRSLPPDAKLLVASVPGGGTRSR